MIPADTPATHWLLKHVNFYGSKRRAAAVIGIPRMTLCRWLKDIERIGKINARPERIAEARERALRATPGAGAADALMSIFGYQRVGRGDDMTCASFPGEDFMVHKDLDDGRHGFGPDMVKRVRNSQTANDFATSAFSTTQGANTETVERLMRGTVHKSRIADEKPRKRKTVLFLYDIHLPNQSEENIELALSYAQARHEIDTIIIGGDFLDCAGISRWKKDPFATMPLHEEIGRAVSWLDALRRRFPKSEIVLLKGNHEDRLQSYLWNQAAEISKLKGLKLQDQLELDRLGIRWIDNLERVQRGEGIYSIGKLYILHGHELGICPNVNPARQYFLRALGNMICGHVHKVDEHLATTITGKTAGAWVCGPMCDMRPEYRPINPWVAGFAIAHFDDDGLFSVKLKKIIEGRVL